MRVRLGEVTANHLQQHFAMVKVLSAAFGGDTKSKSRDKVVNDMQPQQAVNQLNNFLGW